MATSQPKELYPSSTQDGKSIPFDLVKPLALFSVGIVAETVAEFDIPDGYFICSLYATASCILQFGETLDDTLPPVTEIANAMFIPADTILDVIVTPGASRVTGITGNDGILYITKLQQWGALQQVNQSSFG